MIQDFFNTIGDLLRTYESGLTWSVIMIVLLIIDRQKKKRNKRYLRIKDSEAIVLPLKPNVNWPMNIGTMVFGGAGLIFFVMDLSDLPVTNRSWIMLAWTLTILVCWGRYSLRRLSLKFTENEIVFNHLHYKASEIRKIELWDDLIFLALEDGQEEKIWLRFLSKQSRKAFEVIWSIEQFCKDKSIPMENHFAMKIEDNEVFNPLTDSAHSRLK